VTLQDELVCLDWKTGELVWKSATGRPNDEFFLNAAPAASGDKVLFGGLDGAVYAFDAGSGQVLWKRDLGGRVSTSLLFADGNLFAGTSNRHLYRLDPKTGSATADLATDEVPRGRLLVADGSLLAFFGEGTLACLDSSLRAIRWRESTLGPWSSSKPYLWDHAVIAGNERGEVFAFRLSDGSRLWSQRFDGVIRGVGSSEGNLYVGTLKGKVFASPLTPPPPEAVSRGPGRS
jgi:outer membrane protein assembly factor BamB